MFFLPPFAPISSSISVSFVVCLESFPNIAKLIPLTCFWPYRCQALCKYPKQFKIYFSEGPQMINNNHNDSFKWVSSAFAFKCALMDNCLSEEALFSTSLSLCLSLSACVSYITGHNVQPYVGSFMCSPSAPTWQSISLARQLHYAYGLVLFAYSHLNAFKCQFLCQDCRDCQD